MCGWYRHNNLGDDLFVEAFKELFPNYQFNFVNHIELVDLKDIDAVFIGGGSFLEAPFDMDDSALKELKNQKIFYLGVGAETKIHPMHQSLLSLAKLIAIRTPEHLDKILALNNNVIVIPDLVYCLIPNLKPRIANSVLIMPNISVVPKWDEEHWKHAAWEYFKNEFAQFLDGLIVSGHTINFLPMCDGETENDSFAACEIINRMSFRSNHYLLPKAQSFQIATSCISQYDIVITQRFHGIILANITKTPCISIYHHDKLKNSDGLSFYALSKNKLTHSFVSTINNKTQSNLPIDRDIFTELVRKVDDALCGR